MTLLMGQTDTGAIVPVRVTVDGYVVISGGVASGSGDPGGSTGSATAANQTLALNALDQIYEALQLVGTEATSAQIKAAVEGLGEGASLNDLAGALAPLSKEATQQDILEALEEQRIDIEEVRGNVALLVPDLDAVRVAVEALNGKTTAVDTGPLAREATQTNGNQRTGVLGVNGTALASAANPIPVQPQGTTAVSGSVTVASGTINATVSGSVTADMRVGGGAVTAANPVLVAPGTNAAFDVSDRAGRFIGVVTGANAAPLALNATLTDGSQIAVVRGPLQTGGTLAGTERPMLFAGTTDTGTVQLVNVDATGSVRLQSGGVTGASAPTRATQVGGTDGTSLRALRLNPQGVMEPIGSVAYTAARPTIAARCARPAKSPQLPAAATSFVITATPANLRRLTFRYTGTGTKYIALFDQPGGTASAANWTRFYYPVTAAAGLLYYEWQEGHPFDQGGVVGVTATEPLAAAIVPSVAAADAFYLVDYSFQ